MKKLSLIIIVLLASLLDAQIVLSHPAHNKISFWNQPQKGANIFNQHISREDIKAAKAYGLAFIRLAPDKFLTTKRDFLVGNADNYTQLVPEDLKALKNILDMCEQERMPVILTVLSLPGSRWKQNNNYKDDLRLWNDHKYQKQAAKFWKDLASELQNHPAIIGYNILNEPHPERLYDATAIDINEINQEEAQQKLLDFYKIVIENIRMVDQDTPIILDSSAYGSPQTFKDFKVHEDTKILYSFHMYEPYEYTNLKTNKGRFTYPGKIQDKYWDKKELQNYMNNVTKFQKANHIQSNRILVGEFGGHRASKGLPEYFTDLIDIFQDNGWHFAFYAFREDTWDGMDYELGSKKLPWSYWEDVEKGKKPTLDRRSDYPQFKVLKDAMR